MKIRSALLGIVLAWASATAVAQNYPNRPVRIVVPSPTGGGLDILARLFGERLSQSMGQPFIADNRPGGSGMIGAEYVSRAAPDGYTLLVHTDAIIANMALIRSMPYDPFKDFQPLTMLTRNSWLLVVSPNLSAQTLPEFIRLAKSNPGALEYGSSGIGAAHHLAAEHFQSVAGIKLLHVPYKGAGQFIAAIMAGEVKAGFQSLPTVMTQLRAGNLRALGIWSAKRVSLVPDIPTMSEQGIGGAEIYTWHALFAPAGISRDIASRLNVEVAKILADPEWVAAHLTKIGFEKVGSTPEELLAEMKAALPRWTKIVKDAAIPLQ